MMKKKKKKATAEFFYLSDTADSAVEDLISQTKDLYVLEQITAINGSSFTADDSLLSPDLKFLFPQAQILPSLQAPNHTAEFEQSQDEVAVAVAPKKDGFFWCSLKKPTPRLGLLRRG